MTFKELNITEPILKAIEEKGYTVPTPIQEKAIPVALAKKDILGCAQTGTGKTASFAIPIIQHLHLNKGEGKRSGIKALILTPTRELALQISECIEDYSKYTRIRHGVIFGGVNQRPHHGITYAERFGKEGAFITKATAQLMRDFGSMQSPMNAYMLNLGLESLHVRMQRHCANGMAVAKFLEAHPKVAYVNYCGLESSPYHALAEKYLPNGSCGVVSFGLAGGREAASTFMKELKLAAIETHVADARTCCLNPASSTHRQMNDEQLAAAGVPAELVRMSCGLESSEDLIADIAQALDKI